MKVFNQRNGIIVSKENLDEKIDSYNIDTFSVEDFEYQETNGKIVKYEYNSFDNPFVIYFEDEGVVRLSINTLYYIQNKAFIDGIIKTYIASTTQYLISLTSDLLVNDNILSAFKDASCADCLDLKKCKNNSVLSKKVYDMAKKYGIKYIYSYDTDISLTGVFDDAILCNNNATFFGKKTYSQIKDSDTLEIDDNVLESQIDNLKYLKGKSYKVVIKSGLFSKISSKLKRLLTVIEDNNLDFNIIYTLSEGIDKEAFNQFIRKNLNIKNHKVTIILDSESYLLDKYLEYETLLYGLVQNIPKELSPLEKFMAVYKIVKEFKKYKSSPDDYSLSSNLFKIINSDFIVCSGFSNLMIDLLGKVGISARSDYVTVDISYKENKSIPADISTKKSYHQRCLVYINDSKYNINGYYISDPTWDNIKGDNYYNFALLTGKEEEANVSMIYFSNIRELLNITSKEEFFIKLNFIIKNFKNDKKGNLISFIRGLLNKLSYLDEDYFNTYLRNARQILIDYEKDVIDNIDNLLDKIAYVILSKVNKSISGLKIAKAATEAETYGQDLTDEEKTIYINAFLYRHQLRQEGAFPYREKEYENGNREVFDNPNNKFQI